MFESLRKNIQTVQDGITAGLHRLSSGAPTPTTPPDGAVPEQLVDGGADLLTMYQSQWATMHHMAVQNAALAEAVATNISDLSGECESQYSQLLEVRSLLAHLPNIMAQLHSSLSTIGCVHTLLEEVECGLVELQDTVEEMTAQEQILDMRMAVTLNREARQHKLNMLHNELNSSYQDRLEATKRSKEKARQEELSDQCQKDLQQYRERGQIERTSVAPGGSISDLKLEDVTLDDSGNDLENFLQEEDLH